VIRHLERVDPTFAFLLQPWVVRGCCSWKFENRRRTGSKFGQGNIGQDAYAQQLSFNLSLQLMARQQESTVAPIKSEDPKPQKKPEEKPEDVKKDKDEKKEGEDLVRETPQKPRSLY
jgi:hypothetical protein